MILIFSIAMDADNTFYVKFIATFAPTFFEYIISVLAIVKIKQDSELASLTLSGPVRQASFFYKSKNIEHFAYLTMLADIFSLHY